MNITITCPECESAINILPSLDATQAECDVCQKRVDVAFNQKHVDGIVEECPCCSRKDFYKQKDFSRKVGVGLFIIAAITSIWTYGISFIVLYVFDLILYKILGEVVICYKCHTIFRNVANLKAIYPFNHEMNDRIVYSDHDFGGQQLEHH